MSSKAKSYESKKPEEIVYSHDIKKISFDKMAGKSSRAKGKIYREYLKEKEKKRKLLDAMVGGLQRCPKHPPTEGNKVERIQGKKFRVIRSRAGGLKYPEDENCYKVLSKEELERLNGQRKTCILCT